VARLKEAGEGPSHSGSGAAEAAAAAGAPVVARGRQGGGGNHRVAVDHATIHAQVATCNDDFDFDVIP